MANGCCGPPVVTPSPVGQGNAAEATDAILVDDSNKLLVIRLKFEGRSNKVSLSSLTESLERVRRRRMEVDEWDQPLEFSFVEECLFCGVEHDGYLLDAKCHPRNQTPLIRPSRRENK
jgi:hypothetical protein